jgi:hypothetical protein
MVSPFPIDYPPLGPPLLKAYPTDPQVDSRLSNFFSYPAAVTITGDRAANFNLCLALTGLSNTIPAATLGPNLYGLNPRTGTHVPLGDLNP